MPQYADDPRTELDRKAQQLRWTALVETVGYAGLFYCFVIWQNSAATKIFGFFHGWIFIAYAVMVCWIFPSIEWAWWWPVVALFTGPVGGIMLYEKIRRDGAPPRVTPLPWQKKKWAETGPPMPVAGTAPATPTASKQSVGSS
ncbi:MAG TPA: DUF3817 domain-containing protein [Acidimicrobiia bacterium]|jgi:hypothetical protein